MRFRSSWGVASVLCWVLAAFSFVVFPNVVQAQNDTGTVKGVVKTADGKPAPGVNVVLRELNRGSTTDEEGRYVLRKVPTGTQTLVVSHVGLESQKRSVRVDANGMTTVSPFRLEATIQALDEVVVEADQASSYSTGSSEHVAKMPLKKIDNPQVYNAVPEALLKDQVTTDFEDVVQNVPGISKLWESTGRGSDGAGYYSLRGFSVQPTMQNGLPALTNGSPDPSNIDRVEIIKGPSSTLYGSSLISYGGLINVVTKEPKHTSLNGEVSYKTGSFGMNSMDLNRVTGDVNIPLRDDLAVRVNGSVHNQNSFQDAGFRRSFFLAPSLSYKPTEDLSVTVNAELYTSEQTNPTMLFMNRSTKLDATTVDELGYDPQNSFTSNDLTIRTPTLGMQGQVRYDLTEQWTSQTAISFSSASSDGYYSYLWDGADTQNTFTRFVSKQDETTYGTDLQQNLLGTFALGPTENEVVAGVELFYDRVYNRNTGFRGVGQISLPASGDTEVSREEVDAALEDVSPNRQTSKQARYSAYVSDVVTIIPELSVMGSLRLDHFDQSGDIASSEDDYKQTTLSPKFGVIVQPLPDRLSVFGNYMNGFQNVEPQTQNGQTQTFEPERANQWEVGVKTELFDNRLETTLSYYDITVSNKVRPDPDNPNLSVQDGEVDSRGIELSTTATPVEGLQVISGYSYNQAKNEKTKPDFQGRRPVESGPKHLVNAWARYQFSGGPLDGFGIGFGGNYASENIVMNRESTGQFTLSSYTVLNASLSYEADRYRIDLKVDNLTDETYYKGWTTINPQAPRSVKASASYSF